MTIAYHGPRKKSEVRYPWHADLAALAVWADCLIVTCALTPATRGIVDRWVLDALGSEGYLINVARGAIVDETELIGALAEGRIAGAGLDVFRDEPHMPAALLAMDNVILAPHIGTSTRENRDERTNKLLANLNAYFNGAPAPYAVTTSA